MMSMAVRVGGVLRMIAIAKMIDFERIGCGTNLCAAMGVMPAAAQYGVQCEKCGNYNRKQRSHNGTIVIAGVGVNANRRGYRCCRLSPSRLPSMATAAPRNSRMASTYAKLT